MSFAFTPNYTPVSDGDSIWKLKELLTGAGWSVRCSGSGTGGAFNAAGDVHAPGGPYTGTLDLSTSWVVLRAPVASSPRREILFFRPNTNHGVWRIYYSSDGTGFTGGSPSATAPPTAADAPGGGSTVGAAFNAPSGTTNTFGSVLSSQTYRVQYIIGDAAEGFTFAALYTKIGTNATYCVIAMEVLLNANVADADPALMHVWGTLSSEVDRGISNDNQAYVNSGTDTQTSSATRGWFTKGTGSAAWVTFPFGCWGYQVGSAQFVPAGSNFPPGSDANGLLPAFPVLYSRGGGTIATQRGFKGRSRLFKYEMSTSGVRAYGDKSRWVMGIWSIIWDGVSEMAI